MLNFNQFPESHLQLLDQGIFDPNYPIYEEDVFGIPWSNYRCEIQKICDQYFPINQEILKSKPNFDCFSFVRLILNDLTERDIVSFASGINIFRLADRVHFSYLLGNFKPVNDVTDLGSCGIFFYLKSNDGWIVGKKGRRHMGFYFKNSDEVVTTYSYSNINMAVNRESYNSAEFRQLSSSKTLYLASKN